MCIYTYSGYDCPVLLLLRKEEAYWVGGGVAYLIGIMA